MGIKNASLSTVLFSKTRQQVLALLFGQPDRSYHTNEIIRLTNSGTGAVQRELEALSTAGLITLRSIGNQKHYQANRASLLFSELRSIILKTFGLADVISKALESVDHQIQFAFIYGSIAKQEDTVNSDIDLMLISDNLTYADIFSELQKAEAQLGRAIHPTMYSPIEWLMKKDRENNFISKVSQQPKIFVVGTEDEFNKLR
jgi:predicted nucleotidyltransferase